MTVDIKYNRKTYKVQINPGTLSLNPHIYVKDGDNPFQPLLLQKENNQTIFEFKNSDKILKKIVTNEDCVKMWATYPFSAEVIVQYLGDKLPKYAQIRTII